MNQQTAFVDTLDTPVGRIAFGCGEGRILSLAIGKVSRNQVAASIKKLGFTLDRTPNETAETFKRELEEYFAGARSIFTIPPFYEGTPFQVNVWKTLYQVPYGNVISYGELAAKANRPRAARAVGAAMAKNRIPIVIPCHRVVAAQGKPGGFGCGLEVKRVLLELEGVDLF